MANDTFDSRHATRLLLMHRILFTTGLLLIIAPSIYAVPVREYQARVLQAVSALDSLAQADETESSLDYDTRATESIQGVLTLLPKTEAVEWNGATINVDNFWLHQELDKYSSAKSDERHLLLRRVVERLQALADRLAELQNPGKAGDKAEASRKLSEILQRPEYARKVKAESAVSRWLDRFIKWFANLFPKPKPMSPGKAGLFSQIAQVVVLVLGVAVIVFVLKLFLPRLLRGRRSARKKTKPGARIVLGEKLEPDQSAIDLLSEAEALARRGELRAAIRKAYIALLVELGDRKIISLAQYKTNRDYLRAVRGRQPLYGDVEQLTERFERHWYGLAQADETDWRAFRSEYEQALSRARV